jgi:hypothetical protein
MIRFDGIYLAEPLETYDARSKNQESFFCFNAYRFFQDHRISITMKHDFIWNIQDFGKNDFSGEKAEHKRYSVNQSLVVIHKERSYQRDIELQIRNPEELYVRFSKKTLFFVSWEEIESSENVFLHDFLDRFDRNKLEKKSLS